MVSSGQNEKPTTTVFDGPIEDGTKNYTSALLVLQNVLQSNDMNCTTPSVGMRGYYQVIAAFFAWTFGGS